jgi:hypothetical protein
MKAGLGGHLKDNRRDYHDVTMSYVSAVMEVEAGSLCDEMATSLQDTLQEQPYRGGNVIRRINSVAR